MDSGSPLDRDINLLSQLLDDVVREQVGEEMFQLVDGLREIARQRRAGLPGAEERFVQRVQSLSDTQAHVAIRALSIFFDLANIAEDCQRIRVLRQRARRRESSGQAREESIREAVDKLIESGLSRLEVQRALDRLSVQPVFTAHPTEAKRRATRRLLRGIRASLQQLDDGRLLQQEIASIWQRIRSLVTIMWQSDLIRPQRPGVLSEVERGLFFIQSLWHVVPKVYQELRSALPDQFAGDHKAPVFLKFGTWIGGDRDGHPFVTTEVTAQSLRLLRKTAIERHLETCRSMAGMLIVSDRQVPVGEAIRNALSAATNSNEGLRERLAPISPHELPRQWLKVIEYRLERALMHINAEIHAAEGAYRRSADLLADIQLLADGVRQNRGAEIVVETMQSWIDQASTFGLYFAAMDVRQDSRVHVEVISEIFRELDVTADYCSLNEQEKCQLLARPLDAGSLSPDAPWSETTQETLSLFRLLAETVRSFGLESLGGFVVSMTHHTSDVLVVMRLWQWAWSVVAGREDELPILPLIPLFETIDDLNRAAEILGEMLANEAYNAYLNRAQAPNQIAMVGYSDSTKDGGYLAAGWHLHRAQKAMAEVAAMHGIRLTVFHGRGGALGRGGGPTARAIRSLPPSAVGGCMRMTEQGEVLAERYDDPHIALRHLEQVTWATLLVSHIDHGEIPSAWPESMQRLCDYSIEHYRCLVDDPGFLQYFSDATPVGEIEQLPIASRPARRREKTSIADLRAIPWTFAWTQCRQIIPAWFGVGTAVNRAVEQEENTWSALQEMYQKWPLFRAMIENAELALSKADMGIAHRYSELTSDKESAQRIWKTIADEFAATRAVVLLITGQSEMLGGVEWLRRSIQTRNPYVDPLNFIQIELFKRLRSLEADDEAGRDRLRRLIRLTIQGIASGLRTTG